MYSLKTIHRQLRRFKGYLPRLRYLAFVSLIIIAGVIYVVKNTSLLDNVYVNQKAYPNQQTQILQVSYGIVPGNILSLPAAQRAIDLKRIKSAGFTQIRVGFNWSIIETIKGKYDWTAPDSWLQSIKAAGLKPIVEIDRVPAWNRPDSCKTDPYCAPVDTKYFGEFAEAAVSRYKSDNVVAWEIWNEENGINFWKPLPNANQYTHLLSSTYSAIKKVDPTAIVLVGGLSGDSIDGWGSTFMDPRTFLTQVYDANGKDSFDGVAYHPYIKGYGLPTEESPYNGWAKMATGDNNIRSIMTARGDADKGIWVTEFGVSTNGSGLAVTDPSKIAPKGSDHVSLDAQAQIAQAVVSSIQQSPWIKSFIWYSYKDDSSAPTNPGAGYGLWQNNNQPKPALLVLRKAMNQNL